ncbi:protein TESPA1 isoform X2 [Taeniopygia guttata]
MAISVPSGVPSGVPSSSSLAEVLAWWQSDAEEILHGLGFVGSEAGVASRVPPRFFSAPSRASGIDLGLFLRAQVRRLEMEDPCLLLASRFQQLQALAATADAFFCLYSRVSRTPPQRIAPPRPCRDIPVSRPGQRLKRAVSSLCLGDIPRGATPGPRGAPGTGGAPGGCRGDGDTGRCWRSPRPPPAWGHPERGRGVRGLGGAPSRGDVTVSPPRATRVGVTPERPAGPQPPGRVPATPEPPGAAESSELEEVLSEEEEDDDDDDDDEEDDDDVPHLSVRIPRSSTLRGRSGSSGFGQEPLPTSAPPAPTG